MFEITRIEATIPIIVVRFSDGKNCSDVSKEIQLSFTEIDAAIGDDPRAYVIHFVSELPPSGTILLKGLNASRAEIPGSPHDERIICNILVSPHNFWKTVANATAPGILRGQNLMFFTSEEEALDWIKSQS